MAAPVNNQFWKRRYKHGRDRLFSAPDQLWDAACEFFQFCDENPWIKNDFVGGGPMAGTIVKLETARPYTLSGLCLYLDIDEDTLNNYGSNEKYQDFFGVVSRIKKTAFTQKFEGAAVGAFNANLIARDLSLADKQEVKHDIYDVKLNL